MPKKRVRLDVWVGCIGCIVVGIAITALGLYAASGGLPDAAWEIMGKEIPSLDWGLPFATFGIILLLIGVIITYYVIYKKK